MPACIFSCRVCIVSFSVKKLRASRNHRGACGKNGSSVTLMTAEAVFCRQTADQLVVIQLHQDLSTTNTHTRVVRCCRL